MNWNIVIVALVAGWLRGTKEGMVMEKTASYLREGVRHHRWFRWYHAISVGVIVSFVVLTALFCWFIFDLAFEKVRLAGYGDIMFYLGATPLVDIVQAVLWLLLLSLFLIWEAYETAYPYARWGVLINTYPEHFTLVDLVSLHYHSIWMHAFRWTFIAALTWRLL